MGRLRLLQQDGIELDGFPLEVGDGIAILLLDSWVSGRIAYDEQGWCLMAQEGWGVRLQTGLSARLLSLSSEMVPKQSWGRMSQRIFSDGASSPGNRTRSPVCWCGWKEKGFKAVSRNRRKRVHSGPHLR